MDAPGAFVPGNSDDTVTLPELYGAARRGAFLDAETSKVAAQDAFYHAGFKVSGNDEDSVVETGKAICKISLGLDLGLRRERAGTLRITVSGVQLRIDNILGRWFHQLLDGTIAEEFLPVHLTLIANGKEGFHEEGQLPGRGAAAQDKAVQVNIGIH